MVHVPASISETCAEEIVQIEVVLDARLTGSPELAVAVKASGVPAIWVDIGANVMLWLSNAGDEVI